MFKNKLNIILASTLLFTSTIALQANTPTQADFISQRIVRSSHKLASSLNKESLANQIEENKFHCMDLITKLIEHSHPFATTDSKTNNLLQNLYDAIYEDCWLNLISKEQHNLEIIRLIEELYNYEIEISNETSTTILARPFCYPITKIILFSLQMGVRPSLAYSREIKDFAKQLQQNTNEIFAKKLVKRKIRKKIIRLNDLVLKEIRKSHKKPTNHNKRISPSSLVYLSLFVKNSTQTTKLKELRTDLETTKQKAETILHALGGQLATLQPQVASLHQTGQDLGKRLATQETQIAGLDQDGRILRHQASQSQNGERLLWSQLSQLKKEISACEQTSDCHLRMIRKIDEYICHIQELEKQDQEEQKQSE